MNDDADIWAAFASTPARQEPVANRDNSLAGFQRRLLEECGYKLEQATDAMKDLRQQLDEMRTRYDVLTDHTVEADRLLGRAFQLLYSAQYSQLVPYGIGDLLEEMGAYWDA